MSCISKVAAEDVNAYAALDIRQTCGGFIVLSSFLTAVDLRTLDKID
jgi:hypothetical protein